MYASLTILRSRFRSFAFQVVLSFGIITAIACSTATAQIGGIDPDPGDKGTGGVNSIQGNIYVPGGRRLEHRTKVTLRRASGGGEQYQLSDDSGSFSFRRLAGGTYTLTIDGGNDYENVVETVDIIEPARRRGDLGMVVPVNIILKVKSSSSSSAKPGIIDASTGGVPDTAKDLYKQAVDSSAAGDNKKAIELLNEALKIHPNFMTALNELGVQYMALKEWKKASEALRAAIKIGPEAFHPRLNYGIVLLQLKDYKEAVNQLQIAVQKDSSSGVACFHFGKALVNVGNYDAAEKALKQSLSLGGESAEAHRYLGAVYIEKHDGQRAADELDAYLKLAPRAKDADKIRAIVKDLRSQASK